MSEKSSKPILVPEITDELLKKNAAHQKRWANRFIYNNPSVGEHSRLVIQSNLEILESLVKQRRKVAIDKKADWLERIHVLRDETAAYLAAIGDFEKARATAYTRATKKLYRSYEKAIAQSDELWCEHPRWEETGGAMQQIAYREFDFFSADYGRKISMERCIKCGFRNARPLEADLQKLSDFRAKARDVTRDVPKDRHADILKREKLDSINLGNILK